MTKKKTERKFSVFFFVIIFRASYRAKFFININGLGLINFLKGLSKRMKRIILIVLAVYFTALSGDSVKTLFAQIPTDRRVFAQAERESGDKFTVSAKTPNGARIYAVRQPTAAMLREIDKGLTNLFAVARKNGYKTKLNHSDYVIFIARPDRLKDADGKYSPDLAISTGQYAGSVYDKGGYMYVAGMVLGYNPCAFIIGEHQQNLARVSEIVRYEGEHLVLYHNDRRRYEQTADHSQGGAHPILN